MKKIRIRDLPNWPPGPGGAYSSWTQFPVGGQAKVEEVFPVREKTVTFRGIYEGNPSSYHFVAPHPKIAQKVYEAITSDLGKTVMELGEIEIEI